MNTFRNILSNRHKQGKAGKFPWIMSLLVLAGLSTNSCQKEESFEVSMGDPIVLTASSSDLAISQKQSFQPIFTLSWTRGTNHGTSSSIAYTLEMDRQGNDFATAMTYSLGKGVYEKNFTGQDLNDLLVNHWNIDYGTSAAFEARVMADVIQEGVEDGVSETITFSLMPFKPVTEKLYLVGSATPNGWDITKATPMEPDESQPWVFKYEGQFKTGTFKFAVDTNSCWCQDFYTRDAASASKMVYNVGGSGDDLQWEVTEGGNYRITVDLLELTITIKKLEGPPFNELYIVGDASPSGWNIASPEAFTQSAADPFVFTYEAVLVPGDFKISTFTGDWCDGQWISPSQPDQVLTATDFIVTDGCVGPDNKWHVTDLTQGRYKITVNLYTNMIKIEPVMLYLIGDGGPNGWNISNPTPMSLVNGVYIFEGKLGADNPTGELKFSKFKGDWCDGDWIIATSPDQSITDTSHKIRYGCEGDDFKWRLKAGEAGTYRITIDLETDVLTIVKQ